MLRRGVQPLSIHERTHLLRRLQLSYEQMLTQSLQGAIQIELGLMSRPAGVQQPINLALRLPEQPDQPLPLDTSIVPRDAQRDRAFWFTRIASFSSFNGDASRR